jgi:oligogalacturonide lyase
MKIVLSIIVGVFYTVLSPLSPASDIGKRFPSEKRTFADKVTGLTITALTTSPANDQLPYQTHPHWTSDGKYVIFRSDRASDGSTQAYALDEATGEIVQLTEGPTRTSGLDAARKSNRLYFFQGERGTPPKFIELNLDALLADSKAGAMKDPGAYQRVIMTMPEGVRESGGFVLDADEKEVFIGVNLGNPQQRQGGNLDNSSARDDPENRDARVPAPIQEKRWEEIQSQELARGPQKCELRRIDLKTGEMRKIIDVPFRLGHIQANPFVSGEILYCHETGGDAPQRIWIVNADGAGNRPLYKETPDEWVTHEVWFDKDHVVFNIMAHIPKLREKPSGIAIIDVRNNEMKIASQVDEGRGFWHSNASADGHWAVGDNFSGNIFLINRQNGETTLITTDHKMRPNHTHPFFSPDGKRIIFQSGLLSDGKNLNLMTLEIPAFLWNTRTAKGTP